MVVVGVSPKQYTTRAFPPPPPPGHPGEEGGFVNHIYSCGGRDLVDDAAEQRAALPGGLEGPEHQRVPEAKGGGAPEEKGKEEGGESGKRR